MDRGTRLAWMAAREALAQAGLAGGAMPMIVGTSAAAMPIGEDYYRAAVSGAEKRQRSNSGGWRPIRHNARWPDMARLLGVDGRIRIVSNACASGANAIGQAFHLVRSGRAERVLAGGYDALCQLVFAGFDALQALSPSGIPRPFDAARDGLALGEGAGFVVVESAGSAKSRGARVHRGNHRLRCGHRYASSHPTAPARGCRACHHAGRLRDGRAFPRNKSITSTPTAPARRSTTWRKAYAIQRWAGAAVSSIQVSSTKSAIGHLLGGAGAVESVICLMALEGQWLPASLHVREADPVCTFDLIRTPRDARVARVLTNSFGFGGANATLIFAREDSA